MYVDEVQDLTPGQIALLFYVCSDPDAGYMLAGDTAQVIAPGARFRFETLRDVFWEFFMGRQGLMPETITLLQNYRTHSGVIGIANIIVDLIKYFDPSTIDSSLPPEVAKVTGALPVLVEHTSLDAAGGLLARYSYCLLPGTLLALTALTAYCLQ